MRIELVIDELVLHGFDPRQRHAIGDAVAQELTRLGHSHASELRSHHSIDLATLEGGAFVATAPTAAGIGAGIAGRTFAAVRGAKP